MGFQHRRKAGVAVLARPAGHPQREQQPGHRRVGHQRLQLGHGVGHGVGQGIDHGVGQGPAKVGLNAGLQQFAQRLALRQMRSHPFGDAFKPLRATCGGGAGGQWWCEVHPWCCRSLRELRRVGQGIERRAVVERIEQCVELRRGTASKRHAAGAAPARRQHRPHTLKFGLFTRLVFTVAPVHQHAVGLAAQQAIGHRQRLKLDGLEPGQALCGRHPGQAVAFTAYPQAGTGQFANRACRFIGGGAHQSRSGRGRRAGGEAGHHQHGRADEHRRGQNGLPARRRAPVDLQPGPGALADAPHHPPRGTFQCFARRGEVARPAGGLRQIAQDILGRGTAHADGKDPVPGPARGGQH